MSQLVPFSFESHEIRVDRDDQGVVWFVAKDVADALDIAWKGSDTLSSIKAEWQGVRQLRTPGGEQELIVILEQAVYKLAFRSRKPEAEKFSDWAADVIASIRKTGSYSVSPEPASVLLPIETSIRVFTTAETFARNVLGLAGNFAKLSADLCVKKATGLSVLDYFGQTTLLANPKGATYNPTELGQLHGGMSARKMNWLLELANFQTSVCNRWVPTEKAQGYCEWIDTNKKSGGTPVKQLRWFASVLDTPDLCAVLAHCAHPLKDLSTV